MAPVVGTGRGSPRTAPSTSASNSNNFLLVSNYVPRHQPASSRLARCAAQGASGPQRLHLQPDSGALDSCEPTTSQPFAPAITRRRAIAGLAAAAPLLGVAFGAVTALPAHASKLPPIADSAWEALGGGPADLYFPEAFLGEWLVTSVLVNLETPLGTEYVPNLQASRRRHQICVSLDNQVVIHRWLRYPAIIVSAPHQSSKHHVQNSLSCTIVDPFARRSIQSHRTADQPHEVLFLCIFSTSRLVASQAVERARRDDLNQGMRYGVAFMRQGDKVIYDRR